MKKQTVYYEDELNDEFSTAEIKAKKIDKNYKYERDSFFSKIFSFFVYRMIATPIAFFYLKIKFHHKIIGKKILKKEKHGCFIYGNHTQVVGDALIPTFVTGRKTYVIVHPNNVSMKFMGRLTPYLGAIPLPDDIAAMRNFLHCLEKRIKQNRPVVIYPEAHLWPYYNKIRPFKNDSFRYPIKYNTPTYCFTNVYMKRKHSDSKCNIVTYIDGPFFPKEELTDSENREYLRNCCLEAMSKRAELSTCCMIEYIHK